MALLSPEQEQEFVRRRLGLQSEADLNRNRLQEDYGITSSLLERQSVQDQQDVGDQIASNGLFQSGIRINEQGNIVRNYNNSLGALNLSRARGLEDISRGMSTGLANVDFEKSQALAEATRREVEAAQQRALLEAQKRAAMVAPPAYPNPVIALPNVPQPQQSTYVDNGAAALGAQNYAMQEALRRQVQNQVAGIAGTINSIKPGLPPNKRTASPPGFGNYRR